MSDSSPPTNWSLDTQVSRAIWVRTEERVVADRAPERRWETIVFGGLFDRQVVTDYLSRDQAEAGHERVVELVKSAEAHFSRDIDAIPFGEFLELDLWPGPGGSWLRGPQRGD